MSSRRECAEEIVLTSKIGPGQPIATPTKASNVLPQPQSSLAYRLGANKGKTNPARLPNTVTAATADAA